MHRQRVDAVVDHFFARARVADEVREVDRTGVRGTSFTNRGVVPPPVAGFPDNPMASASDMGFGPATYTPPLARQPDLKARAARLEVQRLLESGSVSSGQEAIGALDLLLQMAPDERMKVVDQLEE